MFCALFILIMVLLHRLPLVVTSLLLPVAVASPRLDGRGPNLEHRTFNNGLLKGDLVIPRGPKAPMIRRNGLVAREETKSFSLEQTLENESLFNRSVAVSILGETREPGLTFTATTSQPSPAHLSKCRASGAALRET